MKPFAAFWLPLILIVLATFISPNQTSSPTLKFVPLPLLPVVTELNVTLELVLVAWFELNVVYPAPFVN